jgi:hypothetical protein
MTLHQFQNRYFSQSMNQAFNFAVTDIPSDENESGLHKWVRFTGGLTL